MVYEGLVGMDHKPQTGSKVRLPAECEVSPALRRTIPSNRRSHYYMARATDATPVQYGLQKRSSSSIAASGSSRRRSRRKSTRTAGLVWSSRDGAIGDVICSRPSRGDRVLRVAIGERTAHARPSSLDDESTAPKRELVRCSSRTLYRKEAEPWSRRGANRGSKKASASSTSSRALSVDAILPLQITPPRPTLAGFRRTHELVTAATRAAVKRALLGDDRATLQKYGRFLYPIAERVIAGSPVDDRATLQTRLNAAATMWTVAPSSCR